VGGIALGNFGNAAAASVGLAAILAASSVAFLVLKIAGAAYLVFLGIKALRVSRTEEMALAPRRVSELQLFRDGFFW
jgi:threonine/homoserine/homoserine lactone efflux protein